MKTMGVTLESRSFKLHITTEGMHRLKRDMIKAAIKYLKSDLVDVYDSTNKLRRVSLLDPENKEMILQVRDKTVSILSESVKDDKIDYTYFTEKGFHNYLLQQLPSFCLCGLHAFVCRVQDESFFTLGEIVDINWLYDVLKDFFDQYSRSRELFDKIRTMTDDSIDRQDCRPIWFYNTPDYLEE